MRIVDATRAVETAIIELEYLLADVMVGVDSPCVDAQARGVALHYHAACKALVVAMAVVAHAKAQGAKAAGG
jgi:hypothetical protein